MSNFSTNKKKIRNWKRQVKKIEKWKNACFELNADAIASGENRDYLKIRINPFDRLVKRNPPLWYFRIILDAMIDIYKHWYQQLRTYGEPFSMKIWLYEPGLINSQIVWDYGSLAGFYDQTFEKSPRTATFPSAKYKTANNNLSEFSWELHEDYDYKFMEHDNLTDTDIQRLLKNGYAAITQTIKGKDEVVYKKRLNDVWVGSIRDTAFLDI